MGFLRCCVYYGILAVVSFFIGRLLPKSWFHGDKFPYRCASWEAKLFRFLRVHEWQDKVPDMSKIVPKLIPAKKLDTDFRAQLPRMIEETCPSRCDSRSSTKFQQKLSLSSPFIRFCVLY